MTPMAFMTIYMVSGIVLSILTYGMTFHYFQTKWPTLAKSGKVLDHAHAALNALLVLLFPIIFPMILFLSREYWGLKYR